MPTASTAQILGNNESFEPYTSNIYTRRVLSGEFQVHSCRKTMIYTVFSLILSMTGKINFQTSKAILLQDFQAVLNGTTILRVVNVTGYCLKRRTLYTVLVVKIKAHCS